MKDTRLMPLVLSALLMAAGVYGSFQIGLSPYPARIFLPTFIIASTLILYRSLGASAAAIVIFLLGSTNYCSVLPPDAELAGLLLRDLLIAAASLPIVLRALVARRLMYSREPVNTSIVFLVTTIIILTTLQIFRSSYLWAHPLSQTAALAKPFLLYSLVILGLMDKLDARTLRHLLRFTIVLGACLSVIVIIGTFVDLRPLLPGLKVLYSKAGAIQLHFIRTIPAGFAVIFLALFLALAYGPALLGATRLPILVLLVLGTLFLGFRAFYAGVLSGLFYFFAVYTPSFFNRRRLAGFLGVTLLVFALLLTTAGGESVSYRLKRTRDDLTTGRGSISFRLRLTATLLPLVSEHLFLGWGFCLPNDAGLGVSPGTTHLKRLGTSDIGWLDILLQFGLFGTMAFFLPWLRLLLRLTREARIYNDPLLLSFGSFIVMGIVALPGAALFSWDAGVLDLSIMMIIILMRQSTSCHST